MPVTSLRYTRLGFITSGRLAHFKQQFFINIYVQYIISLDKQNKISYLLILSP